MKYNSKAIRVREAFVKDLWNGQYDPGSRLPTEEVLAARYGVSRITFRLVVALLEADGVLVRVPNKGIRVRADLLLPCRRKFPSGKKTVAILVDAFPDPVTMEICDGAKRYFEQNETELLLFQNAENFSEALRGLQQANSGGILLLAFSAKAPLEKLLARKIPLVAVDSVPSGLNIPSVQCDYFGAGYDAVNTLLRRYQRPVYYVEENLYLPAKQRRFGGYCCAMGEAGFQSEINSHALILSWERLGDGNAKYRMHEDSLREHKLALQRFFKEHPEELSIVAGNDYVAREICLIAEKFGRRIGVDVMICGFGDLPFAATMECPLSSVRVPRQRMGQEAARMLLELVRLDKLEGPTLLLPWQLQERASTIGNINPDSMKKAKK